MTVDRGSWIVNRGSLIVCRQMIHD